MSRRMNAAQCEKVNNILNDERRALLARVREKARSMERSDELAARELRRIAEFLHGFGPPHKPERG